MRTLMALVVLAMVSVGCIVHDPLYCDETHLCTDPERQFCDLEGIYPQSEGHGHTCIGSPFDASVPPMTAVLTVTHEGAGDGTITSEPAGIGCGTVCSTTFVVGTVVTLSASPGSGSSFTGWSGGCEGAGACTLTIASDAQVRARFSTPGEVLWLDGIGGPTPDMFTRLAVDRDGDIIVSGSFSQQLNVNGTILDSHGDIDVFVGKLSSVDGLPAWIESFGGAMREGVTGIAIDPAGDVVIVGQFEESIDFGNGPLTCLGSQDLFLAKLSSTNGAVIWAKRIGGDGSEAPLAIAVDAAGDVYIGGQFNDTTNLGGGAITETATGPDGFVAKYAGGDGSFVWAGQLAASVSASVSLLQLDDAGDLVVGGAVSGDITFTNGLSIPDGKDVFFARYARADGAQLAGQVFVMPGDQTADSGVTTGAGELIIVGSFTGQVDFGDGPRMAADTARDGYVAKFFVEPFGVIPAWTRAFGGAGEDRASAAGVDSDLEVTVVGYFNSSIDFGGGALTALGPSESFVAKYDDSGTYLWSEQFGGSGDDRGESVAIDAADRIYTSGYFNVNAVFETQGLTSAGASDIYVVGLAP